MLGYPPAGLKKSPLDSHVLYYEKAPLYKEKRYRSPLPKPPITEPITKAWYWILDHPGTAFLLLLFTLFPLPVSAQSPHHVPPQPTPAWQKLTPPVEEVHPVVPATLPQIEPVYIPPPPPPAPVNNAPGNCGDNEYAHFIYMHESGCSTTITNSIGCLGLGQACPASKLSSVCPNLDYACENAWFTNYANSVYGGWYGAYLKWLSSSWW